SPQVATRGPGFLQALEVRHQIRQLLAAQQVRGPVPALRVEAREDLLQRLRLPVVQVGGRAAHAAQRRRVEAAREVARYPRAHVVGDDIVQGVPAGTARAAAL